MRDLSPLAKDSMTATSQAAGNMTSSPAQAMTAPGSEPVDPLPPTEELDNPNLEMTAPIPPGTSGKPQASRQAGPWNPPRPAWKPAEAPDVVRDPAPVPPPGKGHIAPGTAEQSAHSNAAGQTQLGRSSAAVQAAAGAGG
jgi:hypothetical protein